MPFRTSIKVCFADIDNAGIVYYPRFFHYFHLAMEDFFAGGMGIDYSDVLHKYKVSFPAVHAEADFKKKLKFGDNINIEVRIIKAGNSSITWGYKGFRDPGEEEVVEGMNVTVCVNPDSFQKIEIPDWLRKELKKYMERSGK